jgi:SAM-dependent methyltransferase
MPVRSRPCSLGRWAESPKRFHLAGSGSWKSALRRPRCPRSISWHRGVRSWPPITTPGRALRAFTAKVCHRHGIATANLAIRRLDIFDEPATRETFDLILLKAVFGGLSRDHDLRVFRQALLACARILNPGGLVLIVDKGWCSGLHTWILKRLGAAGRNHWHYFSQAELKALAEDAPLAAPTVHWAGFLSLGVAPRPIQAVLDGLDRCCFNGVLPERGTVFSAVFQKTGDDVPD